MIKPVYRVQCDGPGKEWLSLPDDYVPGTDLMTGVLVAAITAERAGNWPAERDAQRAAVGAGWRPTQTTGQWLCPACMAWLSVPENQAAYLTGSEETSG
ncbi:hypothetical protein [Streptomyces sp. FL07-04A]|uniref:hypothetical protein n=1 Tax=Streptomyces sp. FL07-04A TaxID=3028658 RepID=UPI0029BCFA35|nr:hypothetical protein [Streptomyces sp. FL07-04A]MDX3575964.1 hypothetical protein [Streptomyces sp. FL07-04A]